MKILSLSSFSGLHTDVGKADVADSALTVAENVELKNGAILPARGVSPYAKITPSDTTHLYENVHPIALAVHHVDAGVSGSAANRFVFATRRTGKSTTDGSYTAEASSNVFVESLDAFTGDATQDNGYVEIIPALTDPRVSFSATNRLRFAQTRDWMYVADGQSPIIKFLGLPTHPIPVTYHKGFRAGVGTGTNQYSPYPMGIAVDTVASPNVVYVCDEGNGRILTYKTDGEYIAEFTGDEYYNGHHHYTAENGVKPVDIAITPTLIYVLCREQRPTFGTVCPAGDWHIMVYTRSTGAFLAAYGAHGTGAGELTAPVAIAEFTYGARSYLAVLDRTVASPLGVINIYYASSGVYIGQMAYPPDQDPLIAMKVFVVTGGSPTEIIEVIAATKSRVSSYSLAISPSLAFGAQNVIYICQTDENVGGICRSGNGTFEVVLTPTSLLHFNMAYGAVAFSGIRYDVPYSTDPSRGGEEVYGSWGSGVYLMADTGSLTGEVYFLIADRKYSRLAMARTTKIASADTMENVPAILNDEPTSDRPPLLAEEGRSHSGAIGATKGDYQVCYTYRVWKRDGFYEGPASPIGKLTIAGDTDTISADHIYVPNDYPFLFGVDSVRLYLRGPEEGATFFLVNETPIWTTGFQTKVMLVRDPEQGFPLFGADILDEYNFRPPVGCSHLARFRDRMVYLKGDLAYISSSEWRDHGAGIDRVPGNLSFNDTPDDIGGHVRVGKDGAPLTGLAVMGMDLYLFKERGVWRMTGESALSDFGLFPVDDTAGCVSQESITVIGGNLFWLGLGGMVYHWDGSTLTRIGQPIYQTIMALGSACTEAVATFDPTNLWYDLRIPATAHTDLGSDTTRRTGTCFRYQMREQEWVTLVGQPTACAVYSNLLPTPGTYAGDWYGATKTTTTSHPFILYWCDAWYQNQDDSTAVPQTWKFTTKHFRDPSGNTLDLTRVSLGGRRQLGATGNAACTITIQQNGRVQASPSFACTITDPAESEFSTAWRPPSTAGSAAVGVMVNGTMTSTSASVHDLEITGLQLDLQTRGRT